MKSPIEALLDTIEWQELTVDAIEDSLPYATHQGILDVEGIRLKVYQLNDGRRVIDSKDLEKFFEEDNHEESSDER